MKSVSSVLSQLASPKIYTQLKDVYMVILFYTLVIGASVTVGYAWSHKAGVHQGLMAGLVISAILWFQYGQYYI